MADKIISLTKSDSQWDISYHVEKNSLVNRFCIVIKKDDMEDGESESEAKTLANERASEIKENWEAIAPVSESIISQNAPENVTL